MLGLYKTGLINVSKPKNLKTKNHSIINQASDEMCESSSEFFYLGDLTGGQTNINIENFCRKGL